MNSEVSLIANDKFIQKFVFAIIQTIRARNFEYGDRQVIHADLVPRMSERVAIASLREGVVPKRSISVVGGRESGIDARVVVPRKGFSPLVSVRRMAPPRVMPRTPSAQFVVPPVAPQGVSAGLSQNYGKITPLLNDPSIFVIECQGGGKPVMVFRGGQKQLTKIVLSAEDIREILNKISDVVHIPLLEGVFRAAVDNFSINAVVSEIVGSRFVIRKNGSQMMMG